MRIDYIGVEFTRKTFKKPFCCTVSIPTNPKTFKKPTGCPPKHDSMQEDLNIVLIFDIICCVYLSTWDNITFSYHIFPCPAISKMWSAFFVLSMPEIWRISFRFRQFCFYLTKLKSAPNSLYLRSQKTQTTFWKCQG